MGKRVLLIDNEDSFTFNIWDYLSRAGANVEVIPFQSEALDSKWPDFDGLVLGPGPGNPELMPELQNFTLKVMQQKPILGICLGFQAIAYVQGAEIKKGDPHHGKTDQVKIVKQSVIFKDIPETFSIVRYHSLVVKNLKLPLVPTLLAENGELMGFEHETKKIWGLQFHPEAHLSEHGISLFKNWIEQI
jgi:anthranilate synthase/aminodeoxychorismate synthase-like glutamine amidotransferase